MDQVRIGGGLQHAWQRNATYLNVVSAELPYASVFLELMNLPRAVFSGEVNYVKLFDVICATSVTILLIISLLSGGCFPPKLGRHQPTLTHPRYRPIEALLMFIVPKTSIWPRRYLNIASEAKKSGTPKITVPLEMLLRDIINGEVELRSSDMDVRRMIQGKIIFGGWNIRVSIGSFLFLKVLVWWINHEWLDDNRLPAFPSDLKSFTPSLHPSQIHGADISFSNQSSESITAPLQEAVGSSLCHVTPQFPGLGERAFPSISYALDFVSRASLEPTIRNIRSTVPRNSRIALEFTLCESPSWTTRCILSTVPFLPRMASSKAQRSMFCFTLQSMLETLTSRDSCALALLSVHNISEAHAMSLRAQVTRIQTREGREDALMAEWEAALFEEGMLTRWVIIAVT